MNMCSNPFFRVTGGLLLGLLGLQQVQAAVALDRTRAVFNGGESPSASVSATITKPCLTWRKAGWRMSRAIRSPAP